MLKFGPDGALRATLQHRGSWEIYNGGSVYIERPFARRTLFADAGGIVYAADSDDSLIVLTNFGANDRAVAHPLRGRAVAREDLTMFGKSFLLRTEPSPESVELLSKAPYRNRVPAVQDMLVDPLGNIWLKGWEREADSVAYWLIIDGRGRLAASLSLPRNVAVAQVGTDYILGFAERSSTRRLQVFRLNKAS